MELALFLLQVVVISLSGVMAPGPVTATAVASGGKNRFAGGLIAVGHGMVELPLVAIIMLGMDEVIKSVTAQGIIGFAGGGMLLYMGTGMAESFFKDKSQKSEGLHFKPIKAGVILSAGNPYFLVWWATVGLAMATRAGERGIVAFGLFAVVHWLCDFIWLGCLSWLSFKGTGVFGGHLQKIILAICSVVLFYFGISFVYDSLDFVSGLFSG